MAKRRNFHSAQGLEMSSDNGCIGPCGDGCSEVNPAAACPTDRFTFGETHSR